MVFLPVSLSYASCCQIIGYSCTYWPDAVWRWDSNSLLRIVVCNALQFSWRWWSSWRRSKDSGTSDPGISNLDVGWGAISMEARDKSQTWISGVGREWNRAEEKNLRDLEKAMSNRIESVSITLPDHHWEIYYLFKWGEVWCFYKCLQYISKINFSVFTAVLCLSIGLAILEY